MVDQNTSILLVEDHPDDILLTRLALKRSYIGNQVIVVNDGVAALDYLFSRNQYAGRTADKLPQLVLLDLKLPKLDGLEVLRQIRANEKTQTLPVIILTASEEEQHQLESYRSGANAFMRKPLDFEQLRAAISHLGISWVLVSGLPSP